MKQITAIRINSLALSGFRNQKEPARYDFGDINIVCGHNGTGKTTMAHAVVYALYGVSYYGLQNIDRLMNDESDTMGVSLYFTDQDGEQHNITRCRNGERTSITLDSYTVRQADIDRFFCDKETFLSMFNPAFITEQSGDKGRELLLRHLVSVSNDEVLAALSESFRKPLEALEITDPAVMLKNYREAVRKAQDASVRTDAQLQIMRESIAGDEKALEQKLSELDDTKQKIQDLEQKKFSGIDREDFLVRRQMIAEKLEKTGQNTQVSDLQAKLQAAKERVYHSKFVEAAADVQAELKMLREQYQEMTEHISGIQPGMQCPVCMTMITEENFKQIRQNLYSKLQEISARGKSATATHNEICATAAKEKETFEQFKADDIAAIKAELESAKSADEGVKLQSALTEIDEVLAHGNLSEEECAEYLTMQADVTGLNAQIEQLHARTDRNRLAELEHELETCETDAAQYRDIADALAEFISKRTELASGAIKMPNTGIRLFEVVRTTGELKSVFRFTYKGRDYQTLSLSEKTLAGMEICDLMRRLTGISCPVCADNTESVAGFPSEILPDQVLLLRFMKGMPLTVQTKNRSGGTVELKKAG